MPDERAQAEFERLQAEFAERVQAKLAAKQREGLLNFHSLSQVISGEINQMQADVKTAVESPLERKQLTRLVMAFSQEVDSFSEQLQSTRANFFSLANENKQNTWSNNFKSMRDSLLDSPVGSVLKQAKEFKSTLKDLFNDLYKSIKQESTAYSSKKEFITPSSLSIPLLKDKNATASLVNLVFIKLEQGLANKNFGPDNVEEAIIKIAANMKNALIAQFQADGHEVDKSYLDQAFDIVKKSVLVQVKDKKPIGIQKAIEEKAAIAQKENPRELSSLFVVDKNNEEITRSYKLMDKLVSERLQHFQSDKVLPSVNGTQFLQKNGEKLKISDAEFAEVLKDAFNDKGEFAKKPSPYSIDPRVTSMMSSVNGFSELKPMQQLVIASMVFQATIEAKDQLQTVGIVGKNAAILTDLAQTHCYMTMTDTDKHSLQQVAVNFMEKMELPAPSRWVMGQKLDSLTPTAPVGQGWVKSQVPSAANFKERYKQVLVSGESAQNKQEQTEGHQLTRSSPP